MDYKRSDMRNTIEEYIINPRYREILRMRYCEGMTYDQIADNANYSTQHIKHICKAYRDCLMTHL